MTFLGGNPLRNKSLRLNALLHFWDVYSRFSAEGIAVGGALLIGDDNGKEKQGERWRTQRPGSGTV